MTKEPSIKNLWIFNKSRLLILLTLYNCSGRVCGCDLVEKLKMPKNLLSYHLKTLSERGFTTEVRCGRKKNYELSKSKMSIIKSILKAVELI